MNKPASSSRHYKAHSMEVRERAELLYVLGESTQEEIANSVGAATSTIRRWAREHAWHSKRAAFRRGRENIFILYAEVTEKALKTQAADDIAAAIRLHNIVEAKRYQSLIIATAEKQQ